MKGNKIVVKKKRGGSIIAFLLGLLMGIIFVVGALVGAGYFVLTADLDKVLGTFGIDNGKDENGDHKYINTDVDEGGVKNLLELIQTVYTMALDYQNLTIGQIDDLIPATGGLVDTLKSYAGRYVEIDDQELRNTKFSEFGGYMQRLVMDIMPARFIDDFEIQSSMNRILEIILYGVEANYVTDPNGRVFPIYVDTYVYDETENSYNRYVYDNETDDYSRDPDNAVLNPAQAQYLELESSGSGYYQLFYFVYNSGSGNEAYISERSTMTTFEFTADEAHAYNYLYNPERSETTGNYYVDNYGEKQFIDPITIGSLMGDGIGALNKVLVIELIEGGENNELLSDILGDITVGDLFNGNVDLEERIDELEIAMLINIDASSAIMSYIGYGVTGVRYDEENGWHAKYKTEDETVTEVSLEVDETGKITAMYYEVDGERIDVKGTTVGGIGARIDGLMEDMTIGELIKIDENNSNIILDAIKDSTINNIGNTIDGLTLNQLYYKTIYKNTVYQDLFNNATGESGPDGQADKDENGNRIEDTEKTMEAILRRATLNAVEENDPEFITFNPNYVYYEYVNGALKLVNLSDDDLDNNGKLTELPAEGEYWTYGAPRGMWKLILTDEDGNEKVCTLNNIGNMMLEVSAHITNSSLRELDEAGIIDFTDKDLNTYIDRDAGVMVGDLSLTDALSNFVRLINWFNEYNSWLAGERPAPPDLPDLIGGNKAAGGEEVEP